MRKGERTFSKTAYARLNAALASKRMLARGYCQVSRRFGQVSRVDVSDEGLLVRVGEHCRGSNRDATSWYDYYRRCLSEDVITDVPESVMFGIRNPGAKWVYRPSRSSDEEFVEAIIELGLVQV